MDIFCDTLNQRFAKQQPVLVQNNVIPLVIYLVRPSPYQGSRFPFIFDNDSGNPRISASLTILNPDSPGVIAGPQILAPIPRGFAVAFSLAGDAVAAFLASQGERNCILSIDVIDELGNAYTAFRGGVVLRAGTPGISQFNRLAPITGNAPGTITLHGLTGFVGGDSDDVDAAAVTVLKPVGTLYQGVIGDSLYVWELRDDPGIVLWSALFDWTENAMLRDYVPETGTSLHEVQGPGYVDGDWEIQGNQAIEVSGNAGKRLMTTDALSNPDIEITVKIIPGLHGAAISFRGSADASYLLFAFDTSSSSVSYLVDNNSPVVLATSVGALNNFKSNAPIYLKIRAIGGRLNVTATFDETDNTHHDDLAIFAEADVSAYLSGTRVGLFEAGNVGETAHFDNLIVRQITSASIAPGLIVPIDYDVDSNAKVLVQVGG